MVSSDKLIISDPVEFHDRSFLAHLYQLPWAEPLFTRRVEQSMLLGKHMTFCRVSNESLSLVGFYLLQFKIKIFSLYSIVQQSAEIIRYPNFTTLVKPASHCPFHSHRHHDKFSSSDPILKSSTWLLFFLLILLRSILMLSQ